MRDDFFRVSKCARCGGSLANGSVMSMLNEDVICMVCKTKETQMPGYESKLREWWKVILREVEEEIKDRKNE